MNPSILGGDFDEILLAQSPRGGRPMKVGKQTFWKRDTDMDISQVKEVTETRYHLGYCTCGKAIKAGHRRAEILVGILQRNGVKPKKERWYWRIKLAQLLVSSLSVDKIRKTAI